MTNNFSTIKENANSEKFYLVRLNPGRSIVDDLSNVTGFRYNMTFPFSVVSGVKVNGVDFTLVTTTPIAGEYSFNEDTRLLTITLSQAISNYQSGSGNIVAYYYLFYTNDTDRDTYETPDDNTTTSRYWQARLKGSPQFSVDQSDIVDGFLTVGNTTVEIINNDNDFNQYLTSKDSFAFKDVSIWQCLDGVDNIQKFYLGQVSALTVNRSVVLSVDSAFNKFSKTTLTGSTLLKSKWNATDYPNVNPDFLDKPIPKIYSFVSKVISKLTGEYAQFSWEGAFNNIFDESYTAICTNALVGIYSGTANREWSTCFASTASSQISETVSGVVEEALKERYRVTVADTSFYTFGDNVYINSNYGYAVTKINSATELTVEYYFPFASGFVISNGHTIVRPAIPIVQIYSASNELNIYGTKSVMYLIYIRDYTLSTDSNGVYKITLTNNFESTYYANCQFTTTATHRVGYRVYNHDDLNHSVILQSLIEQSGLTVNQDSFDDAALTDIETNFSIPFYKEDTLQNLNDYIQAILKSTFSYIYFNNDFEVCYKLIDAPNGVTEINDDDYKRDTLNQIIDYKDIKTDFIFNNKHGSYHSTSWEWTSFTNNTYSSALENKSSKYLHDIDKSLTFEFVTLDMDNAKTRIKNCLSNRRLKIEFTTKGINFSSLIGDDYLLVTDKTIGDTGQIECKIMGVTRKSDETNLILLDLLGL